MDADASPAPAAPARAPAPAPPPTGRRRSSIGRSMMPVFVALSAALLGVGGLIGETIFAERAARARAVQETDALFALQRLLRDALDAETGQRGYLLTIRETYLGPYDLARGRIGRDLETIRRKAEQEGDSAAQEHIGRLEAALRAKLAELDRTIALVRSGERAAALELVDTDLGRLQMDRIRAEVDWLSANETRNRDAAFRHASDTERRAIVLFALLGAAIVALVIAGLRAERSRAQAAAEAAQAAALREANARTGLLARELNHRVKNLFSVILAIVSISGRKTGAPTHEVVEDIRSRIRALALAHEVSQGNLGGATVQLEELIRRIMEPYATGEGRISIAGPPQELEARNATPLGLIIHELATNAAKYGALANVSGRVSIRWEVCSNRDTAKQLRLSWIETGGPALSWPTHDAPISGYGSQMTRLAANQLHGQIEHEWPESGAVVRVIFPLV